MDEKILVAGTFDILHAGHYLLLHTSFHHGREVEVWLSNEDMCAIKAAQCGQVLQSFRVRSASLTAWLDSQTFESIGKFKKSLSAEWGVEEGIVEETVPAAALRDAPTESGTRNNELTLHPYRGRYTIHSLETPSGTAATEKHYTSIVCSQETLKGCQAINQTREAHGLHPLRIIVVPVLMENGKKLSSTMERAKRGI